MKEHYELDPAKALKREDVLPGFNPKKYSVLVHYDLTNQTDDDITYDIVEKEINRIRMLIYEKIKGLPRGEQLVDKLEKIYEAVENS